MKFLINKSANNIKYALYKKNGNNTYSIIKEITIKGGANVANQKTLITKNGVCTSITEEELENLKINPVFQEHLKNGYITIVDDEKTAEKQEEDNHLQKSNSSQLTKEDIENEDIDISVNGEKQKKKKK